MLTSEVYIYSSLAVLVISLASIVGIVMIPIMSKNYYSYVIMCFIGLAFGTLAGDALLHLIPSSLGLHSHSHNKTRPDHFEHHDHDQDHAHNHTDHDHDHDHKHDHNSGTPDYVWHQLGVLAAMYGLFLFEVTFNTFSKGHSHGHGHSHSHAQKPNNNVNHENGKTKSLSEWTNSDSAIQLTSFSGSAMSIQSDQNNKIFSISALPNDHEKAKKKKALLGSSEVVFWGMTPLALMITIGDTIHNFGDGLAIGVAFSDGRLVSGLSTSIAVLCHELPHELGDFAVLLSTGMSFKKAAFINFVSALTAFGGLYLGLLIGHDDRAQKWVLAICAGIFLYVALTDMLPELKEKGENENPFVMLIVKNIGVLLGVGCMLLISIFEHKFHFE